ncbi:PREDICTED: uncharacterized protein LOC108376095 [Rhagoletis zephyria]|uniref:uncharacterized protein LOC108376095 n=1 Tax=Rhagoletis zephyria TaxID=28612 RepID=UPI0008116503|nr:PREDICTED: uncharacterized protein LOC108376095 [Rhagoletis zephyria]
MAHKIESEFYFKLIYAVRDRPCLYAKTHLHYYNRVKRNEAWQEVGAATGRPGSDCKARWKLLRERFCKQMKRADGYFSSDTDPFNAHEWEYYKELLFLKESIVPRRSRLGKCVRSSSEEPAMNEVFINVNAIAEEDSCSSHSSYSNSCEIPNKTSKFDLAPLIIERETDADLGDYDNPEKLQNKSVSTKSSTPVSGDTDNTIEELFVKNIANLIRDLPIEVKDRFQAGMYAEVFRLRAQYRNF